MAEWQNGKMTKRESSWELRVGKEVRILAPPAAKEYVMQRSRQMKQQQLNDRHKRKRNYSNKNKLLPEENEREKLPLAT